VTWTFVSQAKCVNGVLKNYKVWYKKTSGGSTEDVYVSKNDLWKELSGLDKYTRYAFQVRAYTVAEGPSSKTLEETTLQDGEA
jgi:hypothetical protein